MTESPYVAAKRLAGDITRVLGSTDLDDLDVVTRTNVQTLRRELGDVRLEVRDYEFAVTRPEQQKLAAESRKRLTEVEQRILGLSQYNIFSAVEVAELTARIDQLRHELV